VVGNEPLLYYTNIEAILILRARIHDWDEAHNYNAFARNISHALVFEEYADTLPRVNANLLIAKEDWLCCNISNKVARESKIFCLSID
jgi:hypothetical protein